MAENTIDIPGASQDFQTIEDFVNLPADSEVYPRLLPSVNVGTLAGARQAIFEAGGLPATPFATKALMTASALVDGQYAQVTDDAVNNGLYRKDAGAWFKSEYDPLMQSKANANPFFSPQSITVNDLNLLVDEGYYYAQSSVAANITNKPTDLLGSFYVLVRRQGGLFPMQEIIDSQMQVFKRRRPNPTDWTDYQQYPTSAKVLDIITESKAGVVIPTDANLNSYINSGLFLSPSASHSVLNIPNEATSAFQVVVDAGMVGVYTVIHQTLTNHLNQTFKRRSSNTGGTWTAWQAQTLIPVELTTAKDLNTFFDNGTFIVQTTNNALITNKPSIATHAFKISNENYTIGSNTTCFQSVTNHLDVTVTRRTPNSGTTWTAWQTIATSSNIADLVTPFIPEIPTDLGVNGDYKNKQGEKLAAYQVSKNADINHLMSYGQSLSIGAAGQAAISLTQYAQNLTFAGGPRAASGNYLPLKPLVEDDLNAPDGGTNRGETLCAGAANYASYLMLKENGIKPADHVILATAAGRGGYRISELNKGTTWYNNNMVKHIDNAVNYCNANNLSYSMPLVSWAQGEFDQNKTDITRVQYADLLEQLQLDIQTEVKTRANQATRVPFVTYQTTHYTKLAHHVSLAQLDVVKRNPDFYFSTPMYHLPYADDNLHLNNIGYKLFGCYVGRVYKQLVVDQIQPEWLEPLSAELVGDKVVVSFNVPTLPLVLDDTNIAAVTDYGFRVVDGSGATIANSGVVVSSSGDKIEIQLSSTPTGAVKVRYALDNLGAGLTIQDAASGNLRDSTLDTVTFDGNTYNLWHVAPHFELDVLSLQV